MEASYYLFWQRIFNRFSLKSNRAYDIALASTIGWLLVMLLSLVTEATWMSGVGLACFAVSLVSAALGFIAQTTTQTARCVGNAIAKRNGIKPRAFKQDKPMFAKFIAHTFTATKTSTRLRTASISTRNNARATRSASRSTFSGASGAPKASKGNSDDGGSSDSGSSDSSDEPPKLKTPAPQHFFSTKKQHRNLVCKRVSAKRSVPNHVLHVGRCPA